jgi:uncharacterized membrane protein YeaQ/YmgE (transglycosylase-associated protein family)
MRRISVYALISNRGLFGVSIEKCRGYSTAVPIHTLEVHMGILIWLIVGLIAGLIARALVPGSDPMGVLGTLLLGLVGSLVGGFLGNLLFDGQWDVTAAGIIGSVIGAIIALLIYRSARSSRTV